jgi:hydrogenase/urease accessory protein HupE
LARGTRGPGGRLMFWAALFFVGMAINNVLLFVDTAVVPEVDWSLAPNLVALTSLVFLLYGLIWETT